MDDWFSRNILLYGSRGTFSNENWAESERRVYPINETSAAGPIVKSALNITTTCDSYYQTTNKRKNYNPKVQINMDKLKICFMWTVHELPLSNFNYP